MSTAIRAGVRVLVRVRPLLPSLNETSSSSQSSNANSNGATATTSIPVASHLQPDPDGRSLSLRVKDTLHQYTFDAVLPPAASQTDVFARGGVAGMVRSVVDGYSATVFAYGQTGSGKTHTMDGVGASVGAPVNADSNSTSSDNSDIDGTTSADANAGAGLSATTTVAVDGRLNEASGVTSRAIHSLFAQIAAETSDSNKNSKASTEDSEVSFHVTCSFVQIYQEQVYDLLSSSLSISSHNTSNTTSSGSHTTAAGGAGFDANRGSLRVRWAQGRDFYVDGLTETACTTPQQAVACFLAGTKRRVVAQHRLNTESSRSHSLFMLTVTKTTMTRSANSANVSVGSTATVTGAASGGLSNAETVVSKLTLVDLAGSERTSLTGAVGQMLAQAVSINKSLFVLRKVIKALATGTSTSTNSGSSKGASAHVPYRDSTLTRLLQHSLGGNCLTLMIACLAPLDAYQDENLSTLNYAALTTKIVNRATVGEDPKTALIRQLRAENNALKEIVARAKRLCLMTGVATTGAFANNTAGENMQNDDSSSASNGNSNDGSTVLWSDVESGAWNGVSTLLGNSINATGNSNAISGASSGKTATAPAPGWARGPQRKPTATATASSATAAAAAVGAPTPAASAATAPTNNVTAVTTSSGGLTSSEAALLQHRLVATVGMAHALLDENASYNARVESLEAELEEANAVTEELEGEVGQLQYENADLRERVLFLETVLVEGNGIANGKSDEKNIGSASIAIESEAEDANADADTDAKTVGTASRSMYANDKAKKQQLPNNKLSNNAKESMSCNALSSSSDNATVNASETTQLRELVLHARFEAQKEARRSQQLAAQLARLQQSTALQQNNIAGAYRPYSQQPQQHGGSQALSQSISLSGVPRAGTMRVGTARAANYAPSGGMTYRASSSAANGANTYRPGTSNGSMTVRGGPSGAYTGSLSTPGVSGGTTLYGNRPSTRSFKRRTRRQQQQQQQQLSQQQPQQAQYQDGYRVINHRNNIGYSAHSAFAEPGSSRLGAYQQQLMQRQRELYAQLSPYTAQSQAQSQVPQSSVPMALPPQQQAYLEHQRQQQQQQQKQQQSRNPVPPSNSLYNGTANGYSAHSQGLPPRPSTTPSSQSHLAHGPSNNNYGGINNTAYAYNTSGNVDNNGQQRQQGPRTAQTHATMLNAMMANAAAGRTSAQARAAAVAAAAASQGQGQGQW